MCCIKTVLYWKKKQSYEENCLMLVFPWPIVFGNSSPNNERMPRDNSHRTFLNDILETYATQIIHHLMQKHMNSILRSINLIRTGRRKIHPKTDEEIFAQCLLELVDGVTIFDSLNSVFNQAAPTDMHCWYKCPYTSDAKIWTSYQPITGRV